MPLGEAAVLNQQDHKKEYRPVAYYSRKLKDREAKYDGKQLECLALVEAIHHFRVYLSGRAFKVQTDSSALTYLQRFKEGNAMLMRWALKQNLTNSQLNIEGDTPTGMLMALAGSSSHTTKRDMASAPRRLVGC